MDETIISEIRSSTRALETLIGEIREGGGITQNVIVKHAGIAPWQIASVCACFFTSVMLIIALILVVPEIHDLRAWKDVYGRDLAAIKQAIQQEKAH